MDWPPDVDGDVFRRLQEVRFDFAKQAVVDFDIHFQDGRLAPQAVSVIASAFPAATVSEQEDGLLVRVEQILTYEFVTRMQAALSELAAPFGGACNEWGVLFLPQTN